MHPQRLDFLDRALIIEHFGYFGGQPVAGGVDDDHRSFGVSMRALQGPLDVGVGYELLERPSFRLAAAGSEGTLEIDDLFTLEPGLYDPEAGWGLRLEDLCRLGPAGLETSTCRLCIWPPPFAQASF